MTRPPVYTPHGRFLPLVTKPGGRESDKGVVLPRHVPEDLSGRTTGQVSKTIQVKVISDTATLATGDGQVIFVISSDIGGMHLVDADAFVSTVSSSGTPTVQIRNVTQAADTLSTKITIDANEYTSYTAAAPPAIDPAHSLVATGDLIAVDVDVAGTGAKGLGVVVRFE